MKHKKKTESHCLLRKGIEFLADPPASHILALSNPVILNASQWTSILSC